MMGLRKHDILKCSKLANDQPSTHNYHQQQLTMDLDTL